MGLGLGLWLGLGLGLAPSVRLTMVMGATAVGAAEEVGRPSVGGSKVSDSASAG